MISNINGEMVPWYAGFASGRSHGRSISIPGRHWPLKDTGPTVSSRGRLRHGLAKAGHRVGGRFPGTESPWDRMEVVLLADYSGDFEPEFDLTRLSRQALAVLGREWLLHGHLQDRIGMPLILAGRSREEMEQIAIAEWMGASPVYARRMQRAFGSAGTGVDTIFKGLQLDIGSPHQFMDFRFRLRDVDHGEFWLAHCGALMDVEPMGSQFVHGMCHTIEDPTFDATAVATNPRGG